jgi:hypothetical protein
MLELAGGPRPALPAEGLTWIHTIQGVPDELLLSDGGVHDNLGLSWFSSGGTAGRRID